jgi:hypothetical protein
VADSTLTTAEVRDQFSSYEDPRYKYTDTYEENGMKFDAWLESVRSEIRTEVIAEISNKK